MNAPSFDPEAIRKRLQQLPLFAEMDEFEALGYEVDLFCGKETIPENTPQRPSYFRLEHLQPDTTLVRQGDLTTELVIVLDGLVSAYRAEANQGTELLDTFKAGDWFGEVSAISHVPAMATMKTDSDCHIAVMDARLFKKFFLEEDHFREVVEKNYRERSLLLHLKVVPLFANLSREDLSHIKDKVEFLRFEEEEGGETIATEGEEADAFYLVRSGAVKCYTKEDGAKERVLAYYMGNSSFGEHSIATLDRNWPATYETMAWTDVVKIPRAAFESVREAKPEVHKVLTNTANLILGGDPEALERLYRKSLSMDEIEVMVYRQSVKGGEALVIDKDKCIRCNACVEACVSVHDDRIPRISKVGTHVSSDDVLITACYHCAIPDCMASCGYGAIRRDAQGVVVFVYDNCVGCAACVEACPYDVIRMTEPRHQQASETSTKPGGALGFLQNLPWIRDLFGAGATGDAESPPSSDLQVTNCGATPDDRAVDVKGKAIKCDLCAGLPFEACVYNCPTFAIKRRKPEELFKA
jgi:CRP-like cAMP-binding protein